MGFLHSVVLTVHLLVGVGVIALVLLQHGKGADMGAAFGSGASGSLFGATGSANFLSRMTAVLAAIFFATSLGLSYMASNRPKAASSVMDAAQTAPVPANAAADQQKQAAPAADAKAKDVPK